MKNIKHIQILLISLLYFSAGSAQTKQKGIVTEMNSGNKGIAGASILALGAIPTDSDGEGKFQLIFSKARSGGRVVVRQIHKEGYELVNEEDIKKWVLSDKHEFKIVLCKRGTLDESRRRFYEIGQDRYYALYQQARQELNVAQRENKITADQYNKKLEEIAAEYQRAISDLSFYADKFARINKDDLNELDAKAISLVEEGKVDEAIKLYEEAKLLEEFNSKAALSDTLSHNIDVLAPALLKEVDLLIQKDTDDAANRVDSIYRILTTYDSFNFEYLFRYASFLHHRQNKIEDSFTYYKQALLHSKTKENQDAVFKQLDLIYQLLDKTKVKEFEYQIKETIHQIRKQKELDRLKE